MTELSLNRLVNAGRTEVLPCGLEITLHKLTNQHWTPAMAQFCHFLESLTIIFDRDPEEDEIRAEVPSMMMEAFCTDIGRERIVEFLGYFADGITEAMLDPWSLDDWETMWSLIWEDNRRPFVRRYLQMCSAETFALIRRMWKEAPLQPEEQSADLSGSSSEPASIPETEVSP